MGKPMIGVVPLWDEKRDSYWMLPGYFEATLQAGGIPVMLPMTDQPDSIAQLADQFDGFLFTGGHDVSPGLYGEVAAELCGVTVPARDRMEAALFEQAVLRRDKPALGICRGLQLMNAILGGKLYQDIPTQLPSSINHKQEPPYHLPVHPVRIDRGGPLGRILGADALEVNSYHHQGISLLADGLMAQAWAPEGLVEAAYMPGKRFVVAVQWHPEFCVDTPASRRLFGAFVGSCG